MRLKHSKLTTNQTSRLCEHFVAGTPARTAAELDGVNKNSAALFYHRLREIIAAQIEDESPIQGEIEVDECYFGGARKGKRGRGAAGKVAVFGILKRGGRVYTKMILDSLRTTIIPIIKAKVEPDSIVFCQHMTFSTCRASDVIGSIITRPSCSHAASTSMASRISGTGQASHAPLQWNSAPKLPSLPQGM
jgi:transposase-like protein